MTKIIAVANQKGGVGKTTTTMNIGAAAAELGKRVLLVDFDPQGALTLSFGINPPTLKSGIYNALIGQAEVSEVIIKTETGPHLAPANLDLAGAEVELLSEIGRELFLKEALTSVSADYDLVVIDCPPTLGLLTINALAAASAVLIPVEVEFFALHALQQLLNIVKRVKAKANPELSIAGFVPTMYQERTRHSHEVLSELQRQFGEQVFEVVRKTVKFPDSVIVNEEDFSQPAHARSILSYEPKSEYAEVYRKLAKVVLSE